MSAKRAEPQTEYAAEHWLLWELLKERIATSITSAAWDSRTVDDPHEAAEYAANALMERPVGRELLRQLARHLEDA